jgi:hypothetical protein
VEQDKTLRELYEEIQREILDAQLDDPDQYKGGLMDNTLQIGESLGVILGYFNYITRNKGIIPQKDQSIMLAYVGRILRLSISLCINHGVSLERVLELDRDLQLSIKQHEAPKGPVN